MLNNDRLAVGNATPKEQHMNAREKILNHEANKVEGLLYSYDYSFVLEVLDEVRKRVVENWADEVEARS